MKRPKLMLAITFVLGVLVGMALMAPIPKVSMTLKLPDRAEGPSQ